MSSGRGSPRPIPSATSRGSPTTGSDVRSGKTLPLGQVETRAYDASGNLVSVTDFSGQTVSMVYDDMDRLLRQTFPGGGQHTFTYTASGKLASMTDAQGTTTFTYDRRDRPIRVHRPDGSEVAYGDDARGNRTAVSTPGGVVTYGYDAVNRLTAVDDLSGRWTTSSAMDATGNRNRASRIPTEFRDLRVRHAEPCSPESTQSAGGATLRSYVYTLGPAGNRAARWPRTMVAKPTTPTMRSSVSPRSERRRRRDPRRRCRHLPCVGQSPDAHPTAAGQ